MTSNKPESAAREFYVCELLSGEIYAFKDYQSGRTKFVEASRLEAAQAEIERLNARGTTDCVQEKYRLREKLTSAMEMISVMEEALKRSCFTGSGADPRRDALAALEAWKGKRE